MKASICCGFLYVIVYVSWCVVAGMHASCELTATFANNTATEVISKLETAALSMSGFDDCGGGEYCGYNVSSTSADAIIGTHETPVAHYVDDWSFTFETSASGDGVVASGKSKSRATSVLDSGTNYCNMENLLLASGLTYTEEVGKCVQQSSADCTKY
jgi:hypothetical protein